MVDVKPTNVKLQLRARRILREICGDRCPESDEDLDQELKSCNRNVKLTAVKICLGVSVEEAKRRLQGAGSVLASLLKASRASNASANGAPANHDTAYVLCVDGGGSKCGAVILSSDGAIGYGESGPCNPYV
jgi:N-acetylmuramic acid 6-phosphate etherase